MLNQVVLVGRLTSDIKVEKDENEKEFCKFVIATPRSFKNEDGEYETDFIPIIAIGGIAKNVAEYCKKGDLIGIRGRIQTIVKEDKQSIEITAEKITFLSSKKVDE